MLVIMPAGGALIEANHGCSCGCAPDQITTSKRIPFAVENGLHVLLGYVDPAWQRAAGSGHVCPVP